MNDIKLIFENMRGDVNFTLEDLDSETGLETAVLISIFTDARANGERGWWGDALTNDQIGSKLWLLSREKLSNAVRVKAEEYVKESLQWMIDDKIAKSVNVLGELQIPDRLNLLVEITRPNDKTESFRFNNIWSEQARLH